MAEQRPLVAGEHRGEPPSPLSDPGMPDRKRFTVKPVQPPVSQPTLDRRIPHSELEQLPPADHSMLALRQLRHRTPQHLP
ncbi:MAG TPA: hypothetical protein VHQ43_10085 [Solirubrobacterales bacterium]|nr:hypothetical protein [Solirubrobacterales bacterium]